MVARHASGSLVTTIIAAAVFGLAVSGEHYHRHGGIRIEGSWLGTASYSSSALVVLASSFFSDRRAVILGSRVRATVACKGWAVLGTLSIVGFAFTGMAGSMVDCIGLKTRATPTPRNINLLALLIAGTRRDHSSGLYLFHRKSATRHWKGIEQTARGP